MPPRSAVSAERLSRHLKRACASGGAQAKEKIVADACREEAARRPDIADATAGYRKRQGIEVGGAADEPPACRDDESREELGQEISAAVAVANDCNRDERQLRRRFSGQMVAARRMREGIAASRNTRSCAEAAIAPGAEIPPGDHLVTGGVTSCVELVIGTHSAEREQCCRLH